MDRGWQLLGEKQNSSGNQKILLGIGRLGKFLGRYQVKKLKFQEVWDFWGMSLKKIQDDIQEFWRAFIYTWLCSSRFVRVVTPCTDSAVRTFFYCPVCYLCTLNVLMDTFSLNKIMHIFTALSFISQKKVTSIQLSHTFKRPTKFTKYITNTAPIELFVRTCSSSRHPFPCNLRLQRHNSTHIDFYLFLASPSITLYSRWRCPVITGLSEGCWSIISSCALWEYCGQWAVPSKL